MPTNDLTSNIPVLPDAAKRILVEESLEASPIFTEFWTLFFKELEVELYAVQIVRREARLHGQRYATFVLAGEPNGIALPSKTERFFLQCIDSNYTGATGSAVVEYFSRKIIFSFQSISQLFGDVLPVHFQEVMKEPLHLRESAHWQFIFNTSLGQFPVYIVAGPILHSLLNKLLRSSRIMSATVHEVSIRLPSDVLPISKARDIQNSKQSFELPDTWREEALLFFENHCIAKGELYIHKFSNLSYGWAIKISEIVEHLSSVDSEEAVGVLSSVYTTINREVLVALHQAVLFPAFEDPELTLTEHGSLIGTLHLAFDEDAGARLTAAVR